MMREGAVLRWVTTKDIATHYVYSSVALIRMQQRNTKSLITKLSRVGECCWLLRPRGDLPKTILAFLRVANKVQAQ